MYKVSTLVLLVFAQTGAAQETPDTTIFLQASPELPPLTAQELTDLANQLKTVMTPQHLATPGSAKWNKGNEERRQREKQRVQDEADNTETPACCCVAIPSDQPGQRAVESGMGHCSIIHNMVPRTTHYWRLTTRPASECCWPPNSLGNCATINPLFRLMANYHKNAKKSAGKCKDKQGIQVIGYVDRTFSLTEEDIKSKLAASKMVQHGILKRFVAGVAMPAGVFEGLSADSTYAGSTGATGDYVYDAAGFGAGLAKEGARMTGVLQRLQGAQDRLKGTQQAKDQPPQPANPWYGDAGKTGKFDRKVQEEYNRREADKAAGLSQPQAQPRATAPVDMARLAAARTEKENAAKSGLTTDLASVAASRTAKERVAAAEPKGWYGEGGQDIPQAAQPEATNFKTDFAKLAARRTAEEKAAA